MVVVDDGGGEATVRGDEDESGWQVMDRVLTRPGGDNSG